MVKGFFNPPFPALKAGHPNTCLSYASWLCVSMITHCRYSLSNVSSIPYVRSFFMTIWLYFYTSIFYLTFATKISTHFYIAALKTVILLQHFFDCSLELLVFFHYQQHCYIIVIATCICLYVFDVDSPFTCIVMYVMFFVL